MAQYGGIASAGAVGSVTTLDTGNLNVTGSDLCVVAGAWEDTSSNPPISFTWDPAGNNEALTELGEIGTGNYLDMNMGYRDDPIAANAPARVTYASAVPNANVWVAFFTAAGDIVAADNNTQLENPGGAGATAISTTVPNVVTGDMVIDFAVGSDQTPGGVAFAPGADQTERLDISDGNYTGMAVSTQDGVDGGVMSQTADEPQFYGLGLMALRIPDAASAPSASGSVSIPVSTADGAATVRRSASGSASIAALIASGSARVRRSASGVATLAAIAAAGTAIVVHTASGAASIAPVQANGSGITRSQASGSATIAAIQSAGVTRVAKRASGAANAPSPTASGTATVRKRGTGAAVLPAVSGSGVGSVGGANSASGSVTTPAIVGTGSASVRKRSSGSPSIPAIQAAGAGTVGQVQVASGSPETPVVQGSGVASVVRRASGSPSMPVVQGDAFSRLVRRASGVAQVSAVTGSGTASKRIASSGVAMVPIPFALGVAIVGGDTIQSTIDLDSREITVTLESFDYSTINLESVEIDILLKGKL